jgi:hypothetical protein
MLAELTVDVLTDAHDAVVGGGYNGVELTTATVSRRFYWPRLYESIRAWVCGCEMCLHIKALNQKPAGLLMPMEIPSL